MSNGCFWPVCHLEERSSFANVFLICFSALSCCLRSFLVLPADFERAGDMVTKLRLYSRLGRQKAAGTDRSRIHDTSFMCPTPSQNFIDLNGAPRVAVALGSRRGMGLTITKRFLALPLMKCKVWLYGHTRRFSLTHLKNPRALRPQALQSVASLLHVRIFSRALQGFGN